DPPYGPVGLWLHQEGREGRADALHPQSVLQSHRGSRRLDGHYRRQEVYQFRLVQLSRIERASLRHRGGKGGARSLRHVHLGESRGNYQNALIIIEGLYSTEGDIPDLARLVEIKERYGAWLMVDDAHGLGVLGERGSGLAEHCGVDPKKIDILMGTLSKTLASR